MKHSTTRIRILLGIIVLCVCVLIFRLYILQVSKNEEYLSLADSQHKKPGAAIFNRGAIYFTKKDGTQVSAATVQSGYTVAINPSRLADVQYTYQALSTLAPDLNKESFFLRAAKKSDPYEEVLKKVNADTAQKIEDLGIFGVNIFRDRWRVYPGDSMASHALGLIGYKGDELGGRYGLERTYEETLSRKSQSTYANFFVEIFLNLKESLDADKVKEGDIITTIEPNAQSFLEQTLSEVNETYAADFAGGIIIDPVTGEIIAMANVPTFNPNSFQEEKDSSIFSNKLVENVYEMGSIIKPLTVAAGLDAGVILPESIYNDTGFVKFEKDTISNYDKRGRGLISMQEVLNQSLNTGAAYISDKIGAQKFVSYFKSFGLGEKTGIDLPNETAGLIKNLENGGAIERATASFGQGIALTPVATVRALSALANGGTLITPHIVKKIEYVNFGSEDITYEPGARVISPETSKTISRMLVKTVDTSIIEGGIRIPNYSVAAKTGTAQIPNPADGGYYNDRFLHSFFGYFPAYDPEFLVFLYMYHPRDVQFSSQTLPKPFMSIAEFLINYYEIPPDR